MATFKLILSIEYDPDNLFNDCEVSLRNGKEVVTRKIVTETIADCINSRDVARVSVYNTKALGHGKYKIIGEPM